METINYKGYTIRIESDNDPVNPREDFDNLGKMVCFHKRYNLGDKHDFKSDDFDGWAELEEHLVKEEKAIVLLPLYLYDHSGITMNTGGFSCPWDSGQVGYIYADREAILKEYNCKKISPKIKKDVLRILENEVKVYDQYLTGEVYGFIVEKNGEHIDSCWGFYGDVEYCISEAQGSIDWTVGQNIKEHCKRLKTYIQNKVGLLYRKPLTI